jgi:hypothetical protein
MTLFDNFWAGLESPAITVQTSDAVLKAFLECLTFVCRKRISNDAVAEGVKLADRFLLSNLKTYLSTGSTFRCLEDRFVELCSKTFCVLWSLFEDNDELKELSKATLCQSIESELGHQRVITFLAAVEENTDKQWCVPLFYCLASAQRYLRGGDH